MRIAMWGEEDSKKENDSKEGDKKEIAEILQEAGCAFPPFFSPVVQTEPFFYLTFMLSAVN